VALEREPSASSARVARRAIRSAIAHRLRAWFDKIGIQPVPERFLRIIFDPKRDSDIKR